MLSKIDKIEYDSILKDYPKLYAFGFNVKTRRMKFEDEDFILADEIEKWLRKNITKTAKITKHSSSYGLKHTVEKQIGKYIPNGVFILAAIKADFDIKVDKNSPNAYFNMNFRDWNRIDPIYN